MDALSCPICHADSDGLTYSQALCRSVCAPCLRRYDTAGMARLDERLALLGQAADDAVSWHETPAKARGG